MCAFPRGTGTIHLWKDCFTAAIENNGMNWRGVKAALFPQIDIALPATLVRDVISRHGAEEWFIYAHVERSKRKHAWWPSLWLAARLTQSARILETGCGCGLNLIWFSQHGFKHLYGFDLDSKAIAAGHELFAAANLHAKLWTDDGLSPAFIPPGRFDAIIALNWTYHVERFDLVQFLEAYRQSLTPNGYLVIDLVDSSYDLVPNNQYLTSDWKKPEAVRAPTVYKKRYSDHTVRSAAGETGFRIVRSEVCHASVPRRVYILQSFH